jgi:flagellar hook-length control protein FliK
MQNNGQVKTQAQNAHEFAEHKPDFRPQHGQQQQQQSQQQQGDAGRGRAESGLLAGQTADKQAASAKASEGSPFRNDFALYMNFNQAAQGAATQTRQNAAFAQQVFQQVENGMLRSLADGTKQLNIQLTPENLGTVTVMLSVRNKELTAIIRPDSQEAAKAIENQLHVLRLSLEQQGLKVERLEVRPQLQDSTSHPWQGFEQHQGREMHQKSKEERLADLFRSRPLNLEDDTNDTDALPLPLREHSMGLDIVA